MLTCNVNIKNTKNNNNINHYNHIFDDEKTKVLHLGDMLQEKDNKMNSFHITIIKQHNIIYSVFFNLTGSSHYNIQFNDINHYS